MKKILMITSLVLGINSICSAQAGMKVPAAQSYEVGGVSIVVPPPSTEFAEVGDDNRGFLSVPPNNRLIAGFVLKNNLPEIAKKKIDAQTLMKYAMVEVSRQSELVDFGSDDFKKLAASMLEKFGNTVKSSIKEVEEEFDKRMKARNVDNSKLDISEPIQLGSYFSKENAYGFGMIMTYSSGEISIKMGIATILLHIKNRLIFAYLHAQYKDDSTISWLRRTSEDWADIFLRANR